MRGSPEKRSISGRFGEYRRREGFRNGFNEAESRAAFVTNAAFLRNEVSNKGENQTDAYVGLNGATEGV